MRGAPPPPPPPPPPPAVSPMPADRLPTPNPAFGNPADTMFTPEQRKVANTVKEIMTKPADHIPADQGGARLAQMIQITETRLAAIPRDSAKSAPTVDRLKARIQELKHYQALAESGAVRILAIVGWGPGCFAATDLFAKKENISQFQGMVIQNPGNPPYYLEFGSSYLLRSRPSLISELGKPSIYAYELGARGAGLPPEPVKNSRIYAMDKVATPSTAAGGAAPVEGWQLRLNQFESYVGDKRCWVTDFSKTNRTMLTITLDHSPGRPSDAVMEDWATNIAERLDKAGLARTITPDYFCYSTDASGTKTTLTLMLESRAHSRAEQDMAAELLKVGVVLPQNGIISACRAEIVDDVDFVGSPDANLPYTAVLQNHGVLLLLQNALGPDLVETEHRDDAQKQYYAFFPKANRGGMQAAVIAANSSFGELRDEDTHSTRGDD